MYYLEKACEIQLAAQAAGEVVLHRMRFVRVPTRQFNDRGGRSGERGS